MVSYTYKFRIYPSEEQKQQLAKCFGIHRFVHNWFLERRNTLYRQNQQSSTYYGDCAELTKLKKELPWMKEAYSQSLQQELKDLDTAFHRFFRKLARFPRFRSRYRDKQSFRVPQNVSVENKTLYVPKFKEGIKIRQHRKIEGEICYATLSRNKAGQYFVCICVERNIKKLPENINKVGLDLGIKSLATTSDGHVYENIKPYRNLETRLKFLHKELSRKVKGSKNRDKARLVLARKYQKVADIRNNHLHQMTHSIINENQVVVIEDLNVKGMLRNPKLAKSIQDVSWSEIARQLTYKAGWHGRTLVKVDRFYPSSKTCNECGFINQNLTLEDREWFCPKCKVEHDRDYNASVNILNEGSKTLGTRGIAYCPDVRPSIGNWLDRKPRRL